MNKVDSYNLSLNLLDKAHQSLAHTIADLELLREGTAFNQILNDGAHIIEPDELTHILDKFADFLCSKAFQESCKKKGIIIQIENDKIYEKIHEKARLKEVLNGEQKFQELKK